MKPPLTNNQAPLFCHSYKVSWVVIMCQYKLAFCPTLSYNKSISVSLEMISQRVFRSWLVADIWVYASLSEIWGWQIGSGRNNTGQLAWRSVKIREMGHQAWRQIWLFLQFSLCVLENNGGGKKFLKGGSPLFGGPTRASVVVFDLRAQLFGYALECGYPTHKTGAEEEAKVKGASFNKAFKVSSIMYRGRYYLYYTTC